MTTPAELVAQALSECDGDTGKALLLLAQNVVGRDAHIRDLLHGREMRKRYIEGLLRIVAASAPPERPRELKEAAPRYTDPFIEPAPQNRLLPMATRVHVGGVLSEMRMRYATPRAAREGRRARALCERELAQFPDDAMPDRTRAVERLRRAVSDALAWYGDAPWPDLPPSVSQLPVLDPDGR